MRQIAIEKIDSVGGEVKLPGSKSLSNRALLMAAFGRGEVLIENLLISDDTLYMVEALRVLGVELELDKTMQSCRVKGLGRLAKNSQILELYLGNAGTAMRPLCAVLSLVEGEYLLTGDERMKERPIADLVEALNGAGCSISYQEQEGYPPLLIRNSEHIEGYFRVKGAISSQYLTALLMASVLLDKEVKIEVEGELVSKPYIDITLHMMQEFGVEVKNNNYKSFVIGKDAAFVNPSKYYVEGDASAASYFMAAAAIKGGCVKVIGAGKKSIQGDIALADVLQKMGAEVHWEDNAVKVCCGKLDGIDMDFNAIPDAAMTIATTALFAKGKTRLTNIYNWRVKETDRLYAMATELRKCGADVIEGEDYLEITPPDVIKRGVIDTYDDHRMAMCFSLVGLSDAGVVINDPDCVAKTFPDYFEEFAKITH